MSGDHFRSPLIVFAVLALTAPRAPFLRAKSRALPGCALYGLRAQCVKGAVSVAD